MILRCWKDNLKFIDLGGGQINTEGPLGPTSLVRVYHINSGFKPKIVKCYVTLSPTVFHFSSLSLSLPPPTLQSLLLILPSYKFLCSKNGQDLCLAVESHLSSFCLCQLLCCWEGKYKNIWAQERWTFFEGHQLGCINSVTLSSW